MLKKYFKYVVAIALLSVVLIGCTKRSTQEDGGSDSHFATAITTNNFAEVIQEREGVSVVDFWATWCGPCRYIAPFLEEIAQDYEGRVLVGKVDVDKDGALADRYKIEALPTVVLFKDGKAVDMKVGAFQKKQYVEWIEKHL